jgi:hypothetical protein
VGIVALCRVRACSAPNASGLLVQEFLEPMLELLTGEERQRRNPACAVRADRGRAHINTFCKGGFGNWPVVKW